jgi:hypothetical protein
MTSLKVGTRVTIAWGNAFKVPGTIRSKFPSGRNGMQYEIKLDRSIMVFGKYSVCIVVNRSQITVL